MKKRWLICAASQLQLQLQYFIVSSQYIYETLTISDISFIQTLIRKRERERKKERKKRKEKRERKKDIKLERKTERKNIYILIHIDTRMHHICQIK